jgi:hypothetical protein
MGTNFFYGCEKLASVEIPQGLQKIGNAAFYNCSALISLELPATLNSIGLSGFYGCVSLVKVVLNSTSVVTLGTADANRANVFGNPPPPNLTILVPANLLSNYLSVNGWNSDNLKNKVAGVSL